MTAALWLIAINLGLTTLILVFISKSLDEMTDLEERQADALEAALEDDQELRADGGQDVVDIDVLAAERYDGDDPCAYDCENEADWIVEVRGQTRLTFKCCDNCGSANRIHPRDVEQYDIGKKLATDGGVAIEDDWPAADSEEDEWLCPDDDCSGVITPVPKEQEIGNDVWQCDDCKEFWEWSEA